MRGTNSSFTSRVTFAGESVLYFRMLACIRRFLSLKTKFDCLSGPPAKANLDSVQTSAEPSSPIGIVKNLDRATLKSNGVGGRRKSDE
jgi:hypothetical protein